MATTETIVPAGPQHYVWWFPGSPVKVHLHLQLVRRLQERILNASPGIPEEGLLFGGIRDGATQILDFQPAGNTSLPVMLAALPNERRRALMGYYRTEEGEAFHLNAHDLSLADECFTQVNHVLLMIHANGFGPPNATFFFRDGDRRMADFAFLEFPLDPSLLAVEEHDRIQRSHQAATELPVEPSPPALVPIARNLERNKQGAFLKTAAWVCSVALIFALGMWVNSASFRGRYSPIWRNAFHPSSTGSSSLAVTQPSPRPSITLHATRRDGDLELTWDRESALSSAATSGVIAIQDGESKRLVALDSAQVRGGSLLYSPISDQILMQLTLKTPTESVTESVMVILPKVGLPQTYSVPAPKAHSGSLEPSPAPSDDVPLVKAYKPFTAPLTKTESAPATPALQEPPALRVAPVVSMTALNVVSPASIPLPHTPAKPSPQQQPAPNISTYEPPVPVSKVTPSFPQELRNLTVKQTTIQIKVAIDKNGRVVKAQAIPQQGVSNFLLNSAINAASSWRFQPARRDHLPVPSESILQFVFSH